MVDEGSNWIHGFPANPLYHLAHVTKWGTDPFSLGSYSTPAGGASAENRTSKQPINRRYIVQHPD
ncbi:MAG: hypothetical protein ACPG8W_16355 [Candidatus Promineifilaceae bacterium]